MGAVGWVVLGIAVAVAISIYAAYRSWLRTPQARALMARRRSERHPIADMAEGERGRIEGQALTLDQQLEAPLSRRKCLCWQVRVEVYSASRASSDLGTGGWRQVVDESSAVDFLVEDASGRALVRSAGANASIDADAYYGDGAIEDEQTTPELVEFMRSWGQTTEGRQLRYEEGIVAAGDVVEVVGRGRREPDPDPAATRDYRSTPTRLILEGGAEEPLALVKLSPDEGP